MLKTAEEAVRDCADAKWKADGSEKQAPATSYLARVASHECIRYFARGAICIYSYMQINADRTG